MKTFNIGGVHPKDCKLNAEAPAQRIDTPTQLCILVNQHLGIPSTPIVKKGDKVKLGQALTENTAFLSSVVHSPVAGTINKIGEVADVGNFLRPAIFIDTDPESPEEHEENIDMLPDLKTEISLSGEEIIQKVKDMGVVGLGGACFPTHIKIRVPRDCKAEYLLINGVECEPYLTDDYRLMLDKTEEILIGIKAIMTALNVKQAFIGIEANKNRAIEAFRQKEKLYPGIKAVKLKMKYPQGAEKQLIKAITGREVPSGRLPIQVGCVVCNASSCFAVYQAVQKNKPLIERIVTVSGPCVKEPTNYWVKIGTPISSLIAACGGVPENSRKIIVGGPMMGKTLSNIDTPVTKGTSAILILPEEMAHRKNIEPCIKCGKCVEACPMGLEPYLLHAAVRNQRFDICEKELIMDCIECGCCQFTCPSYRPLLDTLRIGKSSVKNSIGIRNTQSK